MILRAWDDKAVSAPVLSLAARALEDAHPDRLRTGRAGAGGVN